MNKPDFLRRLDRELSALDQKERRELLSFYEERFYTGTIYENKTEAEVIAELESPEQIARNILSEYGITQRDVRNYRQRETRREVPRGTERSEQPQRNERPQRSSISRINSGSLIVLILIDLFILSWAIPSLFSVVASLGGSLLTYVGVLGFLESGLVYDQMIFGFLTGAYIFLFLFTLVVLEFFIWVVKRTVIWHMKVLRFKKVNDWNKRLSKVSVEGWFKRHKFLRFIKNISGVVAIFLMAYTGIYLYANYDEINELYIEQDVITDVEKIDVTDDILNGQNWTFVTEIDSMDVEVIPTVGNEIIITRTYTETEGEDFQIDTDSIPNQLTIIHDMPNQVFNFGVSIEDLVGLINKDEIIIEIPMELLVNEVDIYVTNGTVKVDGFEMSTLTVEGSNGKIVLNDLVVNGNTSIQSSNAQMDVKNVIGNGDLKVKTSNGTIYVRSSAFINYDLDTSNGPIKLEDLNVEDKNGLTLVADSSNGRIELTNVYVSEVDVDTTNGNIRYFNDDQTFDVDFERDTTNGSVETNVN